MRGNEDVYLHSASHLAKRSFSVDRVTILALSLSLRAKS